MAKGTIAKQNVINKIAQTFGADYIGEVDKKIYVWAEENGEKGDALLIGFVRRCSCQHSASRVRWHLAARAHTRSVYLYLRVRWHLA